MVVKKNKPIKKQVKKTLSKKKPVKKSAVKKPVKAKKLGKGQTPAMQAKLVEAGKKTRFNSETAKAASDLAVDGYNRKQIIKEQVLERLNKTITIKIGHKTIKGKGLKLLVDAIFKQIVSGNHILIKEVWDRIDGTKEQMLKLDGTIESKKDIDLSGLSIAAINKIIDKL